MVFTVPLKTQTGTNCFGICQDHAFLMKNAGVDVIFGKAEFTDAHSIRVDLNDGGTEDFRAEYFIIACGTKPVEIPGMLPEMVDENNSGVSFMAAGRCGTDRPAGRPCKRHPMIRWRQDEGRSYSNRWFLKQGSRCGIGTGV